MNVYSSPEKFGLTIFGSLDFGAPYEFDLLIVWADSAGRLFWAADSGCSCPTPFDGLGLSDLAQITSEDQADFIAAVLARGDWETAGKWTPEKVALLSKVSEALR